MPETHQRRDGDERTDAFLEACGAVYGRLRTKVGFTKGLGRYAKQAEDWKRSTLQLADERHGAAIFKGRLRTRNGVVPAVANGGLWLELDGQRAELERRYGLSLPVTLTVLSARGEHRYYWPAPGCKPGKFEIARSGVSWSGDGVLIGAGSLHESGHVYRFVDPDADVVEFDGALDELLHQLARQGGNSGVRVVEREEPIRSPGRRPFMFSIALQPARQGLGVEEILPMALAANERCLPPLTVDEVRGQVQGAVLFVRK